MYSPEKFLNIDVFKFYDSWKQLQWYNPVVERIWEIGMAGKPVVYDIPNGGASPWFDPKNARKTPYPATYWSYPNTHPVQEDSRFNLIMNCADHLSLGMISVLYGNSKDVLIEDMGCGMGNLIFYLSKLGFTNFNLIDNFTQISQSLLEKFMMSGGIKYSLNKNGVSPVISNVIQCTEYPSFNKNNSVELFCSYKLMEKDKGVFNVDLNDFYNNWQFTCLAKDKYEMMYFYCRENKYEEFREKLKNYVLTE